MPRLKTHQRSSLQAMSVAPLFAASIDFHAFAFSTIPPRHRHQTDMIGTTVQPYQQMSFCQRISNIYAKITTAQPTIQDFHTMQPRLYQDNFHIVVLTQLQTGFTTRVKALQNRVPPKKRSFPLQRRPQQDNFPRYPIPAGHDGIVRRAVVVQGGEDVLPDVV